MGQRIVFSTFCHPSAAEPSGGPWNGMQIITLRAIPPSSQKKASSELKPRTHAREDGL